MTDRRQEIVRAAKQLVAESGISALSVRSVAARTGIGASTLRYYFPTQHALYTEVVVGTFDAELDDLRIHDQSVPPQRRLTECLAQFLPVDDKAVPQLDAWLSFYRMATGPERTEQGERLLAVFSQRARQRVAAWLAVLADEGVLASADSRAQTTMLLALVDGLCLSLLTPESDTTLEEAHALLADLAGMLVSG